MSFLRKKYYYSYLSVLKNSDKIGSNILCAYKNIRYLSILISFIRLNSTYIFNQKGKKIFPTFTS